MDSFEDGSGVSDVSRGSETKTTDETSAEIGEDITVEIWHDHDPVRVWSGVLDHPQADSVQEIFVVFDVGVLLCYYSACLQEHSIRHLHDGCLVHGSDVGTAASLGVLESITSYALGSLVGDKLDRLYDTRLYLVLNTRVFTLGIFSNQNTVDVLVWSLEAFNRLAWSNVGVETECPSQGQVERDVTFSDGSSERTLQSDGVLLDRFDGCRAYVFVRKERKKVYMSVSAIFLSMRAFD